MAPRVGKLINWAGHASGAAAPRRAASAERALVGIMNEGRTARAAATKARPVVPSYARGAVTRTPQRSGRAASRYLYAKGAAGNAAKSTRTAFHSPMPLHGPPPGKDHGIRNGSKIANWVKNHKTGLAVGGAAAGGLGIAHNVTKSGNGTDRTGYGQARGMYNY